MKIHEIKANASNPHQLDLKAFSEELRALSDRYNLKLISLGAMATVETAGEGANYIAIWSTEPNV